MWACEGAMFPNAGAQNGKMFSGGGSGSGFVLFVFAAMLMVFFDFLSFFFAMLMGFFIGFRFCCYVHGFFDVFVHLLCFPCYAHGFVYLFVFLLVCSWVV